MLSAVTGAVVGLLVAGRQALDAMQTTDLDMLPVVTDAATFVGVVILDDIVRLDEILRRTDGPRGIPG